MLVLFALLALLVLMISYSPKRELFGYAGYTKPVDAVVLDDPPFDTKEYVDALTYTSVNHDLMEKFVLATNKYVANKTGLCTYVIETTSLRKYTHAKDKRELYRCMFMLMRQHGFSFGFSVTVDILVNPDGTVKVMGARTQPMGVMPPTDQSPFESDIEGHAFPDAKLFEKSELDLIKIVRPNSNDQRRRDF